ncbi:MAG: glycosyltransferase family 4 protein [Thermoanaerobaculia bacterium]
MFRPLRILQILDKNQFNTGSVHQMFQAAAGLRERGHSVWVITPEGGEMRERCEAAGIDYVPLPLRGEIDVRSMRAIGSLVKRTSTDVIHVHKGKPHTLALAATWRQEVPAFIVNRGVSFPLTIWNRPKYQTSRVDRIVCVCENIRHVVIESGRIDPRKVVVVYAGTDTEWFSPDRWEREDFRREKDIPLEAFLFAQVGVRDWKGWCELVDAFVPVRQKHPDTRLMLIAYRDAAQRDEVVRYATGRGVGDAVIPVEYRPDMARVLAAADCVVDASWAGTGITGTIREAMALRKPVIATDAGGNDELVSSPELGWLIPAKKESALTGAMLEIVENPDVRARVASRGMDHVRAGFSSTHRLDRLERLYAEVVSGARGEG